MKQHHESGSWSWPRQTPFAACGMGQHSSSPRGRGSCKEEMEVRLGGGTEAAWLREEFARQGQGLKSNRINPSHQGSGTEFKVPT